MKLSRKYNKRNIGFSQNVLLIVGKSKIVGT